MSSDIGVHSDVKEQVNSIINKMIASGECSRCPCCGKVIMGSSKTFGFYTCDKCRLEWRKK